ncbi:MAG TPA: hypothetical protein VNA69_16595 [Thermoanaerobaculia bacterium]|nr:hypothetical protein [Thermoanaerobaculia bacterium]
MSCDLFRSSFSAGTEDAALLAHLRTCDRCLDFAARIDADILFRALGGEEMVPPGGVDAFVDDVMRQVRVRGAENTVAMPPHVPVWRRFAVAATVAIALAGTTFVVRNDRAAAPGSIAHYTPRPVSAALIEKPIVESYEGDAAMIVEVPSEQNNVKIVMIFDESLPADL